MHMKEVMFPVCLILSCRMVQKGPSGVSRVSDPVVLQVGTKGVKIYHMGLSLSSLTPRSTLYSIPHIHHQPGGSQKGGGSSQCLLCGLH